MFPRVSPACCTAHLPADRLHGSPSQGARDGVWTAQGEDREQDGHGTTMLWPCWRMMCSRWHGTLLVSCGSQTRLSRCASSLAFGGAVTAPRSVWWLPWALRSVAPTTCSPCGFRPPSPAALSVLRRRLAGPAEAPPSRRRRAAQARHFRGSPLPAPQLGACPKKSQFISR
jgi:hypothetical protein